MQILTLLQIRDMHQLVYDHVAQISSQCIDSLWNPPQVSWPSPVADLPTDTLGCLDCSSLPVWAENYGGTTRLWSISEPERISEGTKIILAGPSSARGGSFSTNLRLPAITGVEIRSSETIGRDTEMSIRAEYQDTTPRRVPLSRSIYSTLELSYITKSKLP